MRISDWSSDVCSSDLRDLGENGGVVPLILHAHDFDVGIGILVEAVGIGADDEAREGGLVGLVLGVADLGAPPADQPVADRVPREMLGPQRPEPAARGGLLSLKRGEPGRRTALHEFARTLFFYLNRRGTHRP